LKDYKVLSESSTSIFNFEKENCFKAGMVIKSSSYKFSVLEATTVWNREIYFYIVSKGFQQYPSPEV